MNLSNTIEAILFFKAEPVKIDNLAKITSTSKEEVAQALENLSQALTNRGLRLLTKEDSVMLGTSPETGEFISNILKEELSKDLGKAGLETLSIILYKGPISRPEIDYIRGVNSSFIIRNLAIRGLIEKLQKEDSGRAILYQPTFDLLGQLGISSVSELPNYEEVVRELESINNSRHEEEV